MKFYITKYALTQGVEEVEGASADGRLLSCRGGHGEDAFVGYFHGEGKEWHRTRAAAVAKAEVMRATRIARLLQQLARLEKLRFE